MRRTIPPRWCRGGTGKRSCPVTSLPVSAHRRTHASDAASIFTYVLRSLNEFLSSSGGWSDVPFSSWCGAAFFKPLQTQTCPDNRLRSLFPMRLTTGPWMRLRGAVRDWALAHAKQAGAGAWPDGRLPAAVCRPWEATKNVICQRT